MTPCLVSACDPRFPYRGGNGLIKFLTFESEQGGEDLSGDGDALDLVIQQFRVGAGTTRTIGTVRDSGGSTSLVDPLGGSPVTAPGSGDTGSEVFVTGGRCNELLEVACHEDNGDLQHLKDVRDEYRARQAQENRSP